MAMSQGNYIVMTGYVTSEPKLGHTNVSGTPVTKIRVGSTPRWLDRSTGEWRDGETSYYNVKCWRKLAENVAGCLRKGDMILVRGKFHTHTWVDEKQHTRIDLEIEADSVGHDMAFGWSHFNRGVYVPPGAARGIANGEALRQDMASAGLPEDEEFPEGPDEAGSYGSIPVEDTADSTEPAQGGILAGLTSDLGEQAAEPEPAF
jgi:single-strand DNA-binding protein